MRIWICVLHLSRLVLASNAQVASNGQGPDRASSRRANDREGVCQYTFTVASPEAASCPPGGAALQLDGALARLASLEALVGRLVGGEDTDGTSDGKGLQLACSQVVVERNQLQRDNGDLNRQVLELRRRVEELSLDAETLRKAPCQSQATTKATQNNRPASDPAYEIGNGSYQEMKAEVTEVPASRLLSEGGPSFTGCGELVAVGDPVLHQKADGITGKYGVWMQDPEPVGPPYTNRTVWRMDAVGRDVRQLFAYEDMEQFSRGFPTKVLVLPEPVESTGATLFRGSFYYQRRRSRTLVRYDLASESVAARQDLPNAGFHGQHPYSWGGYTDIDLAADEQGLWALYSTGRAKGAVVISKLDPESLVVTRSWETGVRKNAVANAFMACGRLYTVASYTAPDTTINHVFDTASGTGRALSVPFRNKYGYNSMVDYNHAQRMLYAWDNFHMITYDLRLARG